MSLLFQDMDVKVCFFWSLLQETGSLQDQAHSTLWYSRETAAGKSCPNPPLT